MNWEFLTWETDETKTQSQRTSASGKEEEPFPEEAVNPKIPEGKKKTMGKRKPPKPIRKGKASSVQRGQELFESAKRSSTPASLWKGPGPEGDGISFSLLTRFLECRERFRLKVVEGLEEDEGFNSALEFGSLWHEAEEAFALGKDWKKSMGAYRDKLRANHPGAEASIVKWYKIAIRQFPEYIRKWKKHPDTKKRQTLLAEVDFKVPYQLPSGRVVLLRGKWDGVFRESKGIWLMENKTKGRIDEAGILSTVHENLQVMVYLIALHTYQKNKAPFEPLQDWEPRGKEGEAFNKYFWRLPIRGVLYNVIRRPLSDQHAIKQRKGREVNKKGPDGKPIMKDGKPVKIRKGAETEDQFLDRLKGDIAKDRDHYFKRWKSRIYLKDVERFKTECFNPILEGLLDWWESIKADPLNPWETSVFEKGVPIAKIPNPYHWRFPWGVYNSMASGFRGSYFDYMTTGRKDKLMKIQTLFPELE